METPGRKKKRLQPYTIPELLRNTIEIYRANIRAFVLPVALVIVPITALNTLISFWTIDRLRQSGLDLTTLSNPNRSRAFFSDPTIFSKLFSELALILLVALGVSLIGTLITQILINGLITYITSENQLGRQATLRQTLSAVRGRLSSLGLALIAYTIILIGLSIALAVILFACGLGLGLLAYVGLILSAFITPVMILENVGVGDGIRRAWSLGKARIWPIVGLMVAFVAASFVIGLIETAFISALYGRSSPLDFNLGIELVQFILTAVTTIFLTPLLPIGYTLIYYDARVRLESLDMALDKLDKTDPRPSDVESPQPAGPFMSSDDFVNLALLTAGLFVLLLIYAAITYAGGTRGIGGL